MISCPLAPLSRTYEISKWREWARINLPTFVQQGLLWQDFGARSGVFKAFKVARVGKKYLFQSGASGQSTFSSHQNTSGIVKFGPFSHHHLPTCATLRYRIFMQNRRRLSAAEFLDLKMVAVEGVPVDLIAAVYGLPRKECRRVAAYFGWGHRVAATEGDMRRCQRCKESWPLGCFPLDTTRHRGRGYVCAACRRRT